MLFACSHLGVVDKGLEVFNRMKKDFGFDPKMEQQARNFGVLQRVSYGHFMLQGESQFYLSCYDNSFGFGFTCHLYSFLLEIRISMLRHL